MGFVKSDEFVPKEISLDKLYLLQKGINIENKKMKSINRLRCAQKQKQNSISKSGLAKHISLLILSSGDGKNIQKILNYLQLSDIMSLHQAISTSSKQKELRRYLISYLITSERIYSIQEQKNFLNFILFTKNQHSQKYSYTHFSTDLQSSACLSRIDSNEKCNAQENRQTLLQDIERTNLLAENENSQFTINYKKIYFNFVTFQPSKNLHTYLNYVLTRVAEQYPRLGYVQGLNFICKNLYLTGFNHEEAFEYLSFFISENKFGKLFHNKMTGIKQLCYALKVYMFNYVPLVYSYFEEKEVDVEIFAISWFLTLFCEDLPPCYVNKLWHLFILEGWKIFFQFVISLFCIYQNTILTKCTDEIFGFLRRFMRYFKVDIKKRPEIGKRVWKLMSSVEVDNNLICKLGKQMMSINQYSKIQLWKFQSIENYQLLTFQQFLQLQNVSISTQKPNINLNCCYQNHYYNNNKFFNFCQNISTL